MQAESRDHPASAIPTDNPKEWTPGTLSVDATAYRVETGVADVRNAKKVRQLAAALRDECALRGVVLVAGQAEELLADRVRDIANQFGITERTALDRYLPDDVVIALADTLGTAGAAYRDAVAATEPVTLTVADLGRVIAAVGMTMKLATDAMESESHRVQALGMATDCADAIVGTGAALRTVPGVTRVELAGPTLVYTRKVLLQAIEQIRDRHWACPCRSRHTPGTVCDLQRNLTSDLNLVGGWPIDGREPPARQR
jgi:hypothetical protein